MAAAMSHTRIRLSAPPAAICAPSLTIAIAFTGAGVLMPPSAVPSPTCQGRIVLSSDPENSRLPSGENARPVTGAEWRDNRRKGRSGGRVP